MCSGVGISGAIFSNLALILARNVAMKIFVINHELKIKPGIEPVNSIFLVQTAGQLGGKCTHELVLMRGSREDNLGWNIQIEMNFDFTTEGEWDRNFGTLDVSPDCVTNRPMV